MSLSDPDRTLVDEATKLLERYGDGEKHTVAAAIRSSDGRTITALNVYHFTGGPCAEIAVMARGISEGMRNPERIVAVGDAGRGVLSPCGRCRQVLFDYFPTIGVIVGAAGEESVIPLVDLLPWPHLPWPEPREEG